MKKTLITIGAALAAAATLSAQSIQLSSGITQRPETTDPVPVVLDQIDLADNMVVVGGTKIVALVSGNYFVVAAPQVGRLKSGDPEEFTCFLRIDGQQVPNSNVLLALKQGTKDVIVSQAIVPLRRGSELEVMISSSDPKDGIGIEAIEVPGQPLVPSAIVSVFRVGS